MPRICRNCGLNVVVGQGRWVRPGPELEHTRPALCNEAARVLAGRQKAFATVLEAQERLSQEACR